MSSTQKTSITQGVFNNTLIPHITATRQFRKLLVKDYPSIIIMNSDVNGSNAYDVNAGIDHKYMYLHSCYQCDYYLLANVHSMNLHIYN